MFAVALLMAAQAHAAGALFRFQSNFWINLHQTLFREAKRTAGIQPVDTSRLNDAQLREWNSAVDFYRNRYLGKRLLFDPELVAVNDALTKLPEDARAFPPTVPKEVVEQLTRVALIYRSMWWREHDRQNQAWIAWARPLVAEFGPQLKPKLEKAFASSWKRADVVDVSFYVAEIGAAYTTDDPPHSTISSARIAEDWSGLEILFHEASHPLAERLEKDIAAQCPGDCGDLWHAAQFYAVGSIVRDVLKREKHVAYVPYAEKFGLYDRGAWPEYKIALDKVWPQLLRGEIDFATATKKLVEAFTSQRAVSRTRTAAFQKNLR